MPIPLHLTLLILSNVTALLGGFILGMGTYETIRSSLPDILQEKVVAFIVFGMLPAALGLLLVGFVFRHLIAGRCPKCGGRSIYHAGRREKAIFGGTNKVPITYHCQECGYVHRTRVFPADPKKPLS